MKTLKECLEMKRSLLSICLLLGLFSLLVGCDSVLEKEKKEPVDVLMDYKDTAVGDATAVSHISYILPAGEHVKQIDLQTKETPYEITIDYGVKEDSDTTVEDFENEWDENNTKRALLNNAIAFFILVNNVDVVHFNVETETPVSFSITREDIDTFVGKDVREYSNDAKLWKVEIEEDIISDDAKVNAFYAMHPLQS